MILKHFKWSAKYFEYLEFRKRGLKDKSKRVLLDFIEEFLSQPVKERRAFIDTIFTNFYLTPDTEIKIPQNLNEIFETEIKKWLTDEPDNFMPYRWSFDTDLYRMGMELNPKDQITLILFLQMVIGKISMNQHEILNGYGYSGEPIRDLQLIEFCEKCLGSLESNEERENYNILLSELKKNALKFS